MAVEWTGSSPELLIPLDRESAEPLGSQLESWFRDAVRGGRLRPGERLPSSRELARNLGVSRGLVVQSFDQLHAEGYLVARAGSATRVATTIRPAAPPVPAQATARPRPAVDFVPAVPELTSFPRQDWIWAWGRPSATSQRRAGLSGPAGMLRLREVLAGYLSRVRGAVVDPGRMVTCTGFAQGLVLTLRALAGRGVTRVGLRGSRLRGDRRPRRRGAGMEVVPVPVDEHGVDVGGSGRFRGAARWC